MNRRVFFAAAGVAVVAIVAALGNGAHLPLLRAVPFLAVSEVEVRGAWLVAPHEAYDALQLHGSSHLWDDHGDGVARLRTHPAVIDARVVRRFPGTLVLEIDERLPVALLAGERLVPVAEDGTRVPVDLSRVALDLPVLRAASEAEIRPMAEALRQAGGVGVEVSEIEMAGEETRMILINGYRVRLGQPDLRTLETLRHLVGYLADAPGFAGTDPFRTEIDLRYAGQAVVRTETTGDDQWRRVRSEGRLAAGHRRTPVKSGSDA